MVCSRGEIQWKDFNEKHRMYVGHAVVLDLDNVHEILKIYTCISCVSVTKKILILRNILDQYLCCIDCE